MVEWLMLVYVLRLELRSYVELPTAYRDIIDFTFLPPRALRSVSLEVRVA